MNESMHVTSHEMPDAIMQVYKVEIRGKVMAWYVVKSDSNPLNPQLKGFDEKMELLMKKISPYIVEFFGASLAGSPKTFMTEWCQGGDLYWALQADAKRTLSWYQRWEHDQRD